MTTPRSRISSRTSVSAPPEGPAGTGATAMAHSPMAEGSPPPVPPACLPRNMIAPAAVPTTSPALQLASAIARVWWSCPLWCSRPMPGIDNRGPWCRWGIPGSIRGDLLGRPRAGRGWRPVVLRVALGADHAEGAEDDHDADDRREQAAEIEHLGVADAQQVREDQPADDRACQPQQEGGEEAHPVVAGHDQPPGEAGDDAEDDRTDHGRPFLGGRTGGSCATRVRRGSVPPALATGAGRGHVIEGAFSGHIPGVPLGHWPTPRA